jgi:hypothetical protein
VSGSHWISGEQGRRLALDEDTITHATLPGPVSRRQETAALVWQRA